MLEDRRYDELVAAEGVSSVETDPFVDSRNDRFDALAGWMTEDELATRLR